MIEAHIRPDSLFPHFKKIRFFPNSESLYIINLINSINMKRRIILPLILLGLTASAGGNSPWTGEKTWYWSPTSVNGGAVWGNAGYAAGPQDGGSEITGGWWGCGPEDGICPDKFNWQQVHAGSLYSQYIGDTFTASKMVFDDAEGTITVFAPNGQQIRQGSYFMNMTPSEIIYSKGTLYTSPGAILWPFAINTNGDTPERFNITWLSDDKMILNYAPEASSNWQECTWWSFGTEQPESYPVMPWTGERTWYWSPTSVNNGAVWGNAGYLAGAQDGSDNINGAWWGCGYNDGLCEDTFVSQTQHAGSNYDKYQGGCYGLSHMTVYESGFALTYDNNNNLIDMGRWGIEGYNGNEITNAEKYSRGTLEVSEGAILWPFAINLSLQGYMPTSLEIGWLSDDRLILIYAPQGTGAWGECTWWSFGTAAPQTGVTSPAVDTPCSSVEYYTIDGRKVDHPGHGHFYVRKTGSNTRVIYYQ